MKSLKVTMRSTVLVLLEFVLAVQFVSAQCENKRGFAKRACEAGRIVPGVNAGANPAGRERPKSEPLSTTFSDAICLDTLPPSVEPKAFKALTKLERTDDGAFVLKTGIFEAYVQTFSLEPGERGPNRIGGFYPAPIKGRRARVIADVLKQAELHPDVPQNDIQQLLWAIAGGADLEKMPPQVQQTAARILPREMLAPLQGAVVAKAVENTLLRMINRRLNRNPQTKQSGAGADQEDDDTGQDFGPAEGRTVGNEASSSPVSPALADGPVLRGTWVQMPGKFYVRYLPENYTRTRVEVIVPDAAMGQEDSRRPLVFDPTRYLAVYSQTPIQRLGITLRQVGVAKP